MTIHTRKNFIRNTALATAGIAFSKYGFAQPPADYTYASITEVSEAIRQKKVSPVEITKACLKRIERLNPKLNAFITITGEQALKEAKSAETEIRNGKWKGLLHGIPIALKDNIDTAGVLTTAASAVYKDRIPKEDAELVKKLKKAGAVLIGKLNMHEFALGTTSHISHYGVVRNPWNTKYIPGGSSGGSGVAVSAGMCYAAMATDTGGSIRLPASCCGVTGFKPTYGLISTIGIIPVIQSVDHAGPICRTVEDTAILLNVLASSTAGENNCNWDYRASFNKIKNPRIGIIKNHKASVEVCAVFMKAVSIFKSLGFKTGDSELPIIPLSVIGDAEIEAYHRHLMDQYKELYDPVTFNDINLSKKISITDYIKGLEKMEADREGISEKLFKNIDVYILPTTTTVTPTIEEAKIKGPFALDPYHTEFNYFGLPSISIPCGFDSNSMPLGLQIVGPRWGEAKVLDIAFRYQQATGWHLKHPSV